MFCNQCGSKIPDNSKFCGVCGAKQEAMPVAEVPRKPDTEILVENPPVLFGDGNDVPAPEWKDPVDVVEVPAPKDKPDFLKNLNLKTILMAAGALVLVIALIVGGIAMFSSKDSENAFVCYSDGKYKLVTNMKKGETLNIASAKSDDVDYFAVRFSPDGKYVYYMTKYDYYGTGSLCRAEYGKLKDGSKRNDKYIETIASNVDADSLQFTEKGEILYLNGDDTLYHYNGKEVNQLAKRVANFRVDEKDRVIYSVDDDEGESSLYGLKLKSPEEKTKLISNYRNIHWSDDLDNILFTKENDDGTKTLYKTSFDGEEEKLGENANILYGNEKIYVTIGTGEKLSLYQFVNDPNATAEAGIVEPVEDAFYVPNYEYPLITLDNAKETDFPELYTSCTRDLYWFGERTYRCYSMEEALERSWGDNTVQIHEATRNFINKFSASADEDGYIKVTPEVKTALQAINAANGGSDAQWLWLCYNKVEDGVRFDYDAWDSAWNQWYEVRDRISLREQLQNEENYIPLMNLCVFEEGKLSVIANDVVDYNQVSGALMFNTVDMLDKTVNIEEIYGVYDVADMLEVQLADRNHFVINGTDTVGQISEQTLQAYEEASEEASAAMRFTEENVFLYNSDGYLAIAPLKNGEIGEFEMISDDAGEFAVNDGLVLYAAGVYYNDGTAYCDVYEYEDGENTLVARDVMYDAVRLYEDGQLVVYTDYRYDYGYELSVVNKKGDMTLVGDGIRNVTRADKNLMLYISDGDLFMYDGKDKKMVCSDVDMYWAKEQLSPEVSFYGG